MELSEITIIMLNQIIYPFIAKWDKKCKRGLSKEEGVKLEKDLDDLQLKLKIHVDILGDL